MIRVHDLTLPFDHDPGDLNKALAKRLGLRISAPSKSSDCASVH